MEEDEGMAAIRASKKALRQGVAQALEKLTSGAVEEQSRKAVAKLFTSKEYHEAARISVYLSIEGKEIQTTSIIEDALRSEKQVFVPFVHQAGSSASDRASRMDMLMLHSLDDLQSFKRDKWGIPSIPPESVDDRENCLGGCGVRDRVEDRTPGVGLDLIVVPGMAFDKGLGRLGHGKGYYDRFLRRCNEQVEAGHMKKMPFLVGLALNEQTLPDGESVPVSKHDWLVDRVIDGDGRSI